MKYVPILFSTPMVQAIDQDRKFQTRRIIKSKHKSGLFQVCKMYDGTPYRIESLDWDERNCEKNVLPKADIGDVFWVRETLYKNGEMGLEYVADNTVVDEEIIPLDFNVRLDKQGYYKFCQIPSIYMPKALCRTFLEVTNVRIERLYDISEEDAIEEGIIGLFDTFLNKTLYRDYTIKTFESFSLNAVPSFFSLWLSINGKESIDRNPWVWVYDFKKIDKPNNFLQ